MGHDEKHIAVALQIEKKKVEMLRKAIENEVCYFCQKKVRRYLKWSMEDTEPGE